MKLTRGQILFAVVLGIGFILYGIMQYIFCSSRVDTLKFSDHDLVDDMPTGWTPKRNTRPSGSVHGFYQVDFSSLKELNRSELRKGFYGNFQGGSLNVILGRYKFVGAAKIQKPFEGVVVRLEPVQAPFEYSKGSDRRVWEIFWYLPIKGNDNGDLRQTIADAKSGELSFAEQDLISIVDVSPATVNRAGIVHVFSPKLNAFAVSNRVFRLSLADPVGDAANEEVERIKLRMRDLTAEVAKPGLTPQRIEEIGKEADQLKARLKELEATR